MDKRVNYLIGLDTETCNGILIDDKLDLTQSLVYDIGWAITDKRGRIYKTRSFVVKEIFYGMADVMASAYYANKIPQYKEDIKNALKASKSAVLMKVYHNFEEVRELLKESGMEENALMVSRLGLENEREIDIRSVNDVKLNYLSTILTRRK